MTSTEKSTVFWAWFQANESDFPVTPEFDETFGAALSTRLEAIKAGLAYEISIPADGQKELVVSADGIPELIPYVRELVESAPELGEWKVTAFRPRMSNYSRFTLDFEGHSFDPQNILCFSRIEDGHFDLTIYHPDYSDDMKDLLVNSTYILLDMALGEYDVMTGIRYIDHQQLPSEPEAAGLYKFQDLRSVFDSNKVGAN